MALLKPRSRAREVALQLLFQHDQNPTTVPRKAILAFAKERMLGDLDAAAFGMAIYDGVVQHREAIDKLIIATAENWRLNRMQPVDRNVLRLGTFELRFAAEPTPLEVAIDECVELSRRFGGADSPAFVNGILDKIAKPAAGA
jgi:transcription antitermination protein NusB